MTAVNAAPGSPQPKSSGKIRRWALLEIGRNSVSPWITPRTTALRRSITGGEPTGASRATGAGPVATLTPMQQRSLGATGLKVSRLGLGTMTWGRDTDEHEARDQLIAFAEAGARNNAAGKLCVFVKSGANEGVGYAVPIDLVKRSLDQLRDERRRNGQNQQRRELLRRARVVGPGRGNHKTGQRSGSGNGWQETL